MKTYKNHSEKIELIRSGKLSLQENIKSFLRKIDEKKHLNAYNSVFQDAVEAASYIESKIIAGTAGKLAGMVIAIKDVLAIKDRPLTCSSKILENFNSIYTATAVLQLINEDAIIIGKTNCDEFAMGSSSENSAFGAVLNPFDTSRVPGGSSGGSAVAVAADLCDAALGTDTGGSIRQPAAFCGIYGLKPTYGRVSRYGLTAYGSSFDTIGPFAKTVDDIALIFEVISGTDCNDSTCADLIVPSLSSINNKKSSFIVGIPIEYFQNGLDGEINSLIKKTVDKLKNNGCSITNISLPHTKYAIPTYYILTTAEASSNLARYDGAHYGYRTGMSKNLEKMFTKSRTEGFGNEVKRRIMLGTYVLSAGYYDAYYRKAQKVRRLLKNDFENAFSSVDLILTPTTPTPAFKLGEKSSNPLEMYLMDIYTISANLAGIPAINVPIGHSLSGLPLGMQILANQFEEEKLISFIRRNFS